MNNSGLNCAGPFTHGYFSTVSTTALGSLGGSAVKNPPANAGDLRDMGSILGGEDPLEEGISSILAWRIHGQRSLVGYSPWGYKESDMTEVT